MATVVREGVPSELLPTPEFRPVVAFAIDYFMKSGYQQAPSTAVLMAEYGDTLADREFTFGEAEDSVEWALDDLRGSYVQKKSQVFVKSLAKAVMEAETADKVEVMSNYATVLVGMVSMLSRRDMQSDAREGLQQRWSAYKAREANVGVYQGIMFGPGFEAVDAHVMGVHPGELAVLGAPPKSGKSYLLDLIALHEWQRGRTPCLVTLENSVEMTLDRLACLATGVDPRDYARGELSEAAQATVAVHLEVFRNAAHPLWVISLDPARRTVEHIVHEAQVRGCDSLILDQLTFVNGDERRERPAQIRAITHKLKEMISTSRVPIPCLAAHQVNREGHKAAQKLGYLEMYHMAEGSEIERTIDLGFGLFASNEERTLGRAKLQTLASRRTDLKSWSISAHFRLGEFRVLNEWQPPTS